MVNYILILSIAALYVLGMYQGAAVAEVVDESIKKIYPDSELSSIGRFMLVYMWPITTLAVMCRRES